MVDMRLVLYLVAAGVTATAILPGATPAWAAPSSAAGVTAPTIVLLNSNVDPAAKFSAYGVAPKRVFSHGLIGFSGDLTSAQRGGLASDPDVVMVAPDRVHSFRANGLPGTRIKGAVVEGAGQTQKGTTPIEQTPQIATRGFRRVGGLAMDNVRVDNRDDRVDADIAIMDSGIQPDQPDLRVAGGFDCADNTGNWSDVEGHGTTVAGVAAAKDNKFGIVGVAAGARLWSVRVLDSNLEGTDSAALCGVDWVTQHSNRIDVLNMSLGGPGFDDGHCGRRNNDPIHFAICQLVKTGVVPVASAGNDSTDVNIVFPAAYREVITVSGIADSDGAPGGHGGPEPCYGTADDTFAFFSNFGAGIAIAAPAVCISSTYIGSDVVTDSGTSFAAPFVSGAAAVYLASNRGQNQPGPKSRGSRTEEVRQVLHARRERGHIPGDPDRYNEGVLNVAGL
jgi:subtilisin family serine protease